jgi:hypothetical protein
MEEEENVCMCSETKFMWTIAECMWKREEGERKGYYNENVYVCKTIIIYNL